MKTQVDTLIQEAELLLSAQPYDFSHDQEHHRRVWATACAIMDQEQLEIDEEALQVACMWHDVVLETKDEQENRQTHIDETNSLLDTRMRELELDETFRETVLGAIRDHPYEKNVSRSVVGQVLFDADKLDALEPVRYREIMERIRNKTLSAFKKAMYVQAGKLWLRTMRRRYHFEASSVMHDARIEVLLADQEVLAVGKEIGLDIVKLVGKRS